MRDIGTLKPPSGSRLSGPFTGVDIPTLRDGWQTAPYLHDGSAATLEDAVRAHRGLSVAEGELDILVSYLRQIDAREPAPVLPGVTPTPTPTPDPSNKPPFVQLDGPLGSAPYVQGEVIALKVLAGDEDGRVAKVAFYADGIWLGADETSPYTLAWAGAAVGAHQVTAKAWDDKGASTTSAAALVVVLPREQPQATFKAYLPLVGKP
jgi:hypothetical protein